MILTSDEAVKLKREFYKRRASEVPPEEKRKRDILKWLADPHRSFADLVEVDSILFQQLSTKAKG